MGDRLTRIVLADGTQCELAHFDPVLERICAALQGVPAELQREVGRALLEFAVGYVGVHEPAAVPSRDPGA